MKMKTHSWLGALVFVGGLVGGVCAQSTEPSTFCRFVKERKDDFAWENDKIAFRAYGPALKKSAEDSGFDAWLKRVDYPIINKWYKQNTEGRSYHVDHGEGYDPYKVGASRGCGGLALWLNGKMVPSNVFKNSRIEKKTKKESIFVLNYEWKHGGATYTEEKRISIKLGDRVFKSSSTFKKNGQPAANLPIAIGLVRHHETDDVDNDPGEGWMSVWETLDGDALGTGVVIDPSRIEEIKVLETGKPLGDHALLITKTDSAGKLEYYAGYAWERAGEITSRDEWMLYLSEFAKRN